MLPVAVVGRARAAAVAAAAAAVVVLVAAAVEVAAVAVAVVVRVWDYRAAPLSLVLDALRGRPPRVSHDGWLPRPRWLAVTR